MNSKTDKYDKIIDLSKRRGILWNSFEIYGGTSGFFDYGPIGCIIKRQIENIWKEFYIIQENFMEIETPTIGIQDIYIASGHLSKFSDPLCECSNCKHVFRADHILENNNIFSFDQLDINSIYNNINQHSIVCPDCHSKLTNVSEFNLMFKTSIGPNNDKYGYLRPETAQGIFINFQRIANYYRNKLPFGCIQIGKSYRNEISPRQGILRLREFTQAECEIFVDPNNKSKDTTKYNDYIVNLLTKKNEYVISCTLKKALDQKIFANSYIGYYIGLTQCFLIRLGIHKENIRFRQHKDNEMAHYAIDCWDTEIFTERFGWIEVAGIADRTDYDLKAHMNHSNSKLLIYKEYENYKNITKNKINIDMKKLGRLFREKSIDIKNILNNINEENIDKIKYNNDSILININEEKYIIPLDIISFNKEEEKISGESIIPHVIEPSYGIDRILYCVLENSYIEDTINNKEEIRTYLKLKYELCPYKLSILPLIQKDSLINISKKIYKDLIEKYKILIYYDEIGTIGKRYRRNDEIGIPYSITIDFDTLKNNTVTIRNRDSMNQIRVNIIDIYSEIIKLNKNLKN